jgi:carboxyl-terminal processing protease
MDNQPTSLSPEARPSVSKTSWRTRLGLVGVGVVLMAASFVGGLIVSDRLKPKIDPADFSSLNEIRSVLKQKYDGDLDDQKMLDGAKAGIAAATGDPYTTYLNKEATKQLEDDLSGTLSGIGAEVGIRSAKLVVISPIADSPAAKAGLRAKDEIIKINGEDTNGLSLDEAVRKIRGPEGTTVKLTLIRDNGTPFEISITRAVINVESVKSSMKAGSVGYIQIVRFGSDTGEKVRAAAVSLKSQGAKSFVLDVRNNPGGYLEASVQVAGVWLDRKLVVEERRGAKVTNSHTSSGTGSLVGVKTVVLINGGSASASEIVAGALQDHKAATLVGEKSFGKGSVQELAPLDGGGNLKVTIAHWYTPKGKNINKEGISPDVEVKLVAADFEAGRDPQLDKALELLK